MSFYAHQIKTLVRYVKQCVLILQFTLKLFQDQVIALLNIKWKMPPLPQC